MLHASSLRAWCNGTHFVLSLLPALESTGSIKFQVNLWLKRQASCHHAAHAVLLLVHTLGRLRHTNAHLVQQRYLHFALAQHRPAAGCERYGLQSERHGYVCLCSHPLPH